MRNKAPLISTDLAWVFGDCVAIEKMLGNDVAHHHVATPDSDSWNRIRTVTPDSNPEKRALWHDVLSWCLCSPA